MASAPATYALKQGAQLLLNMQLQQDDGTPIDITGATLFAEIRDQSNNLVATPVLAVTEATSGQFTYSAVSTTSWATGTLRSDLFLTLNGVPYFTQTFFIICSAPVTNPADQT